MSKLLFVCKKFSEMKEKEISEVMKTAGFNWHLQIKKVNTDLRVDVFCLKVEGTDNKICSIKAQLEVQITSTSPRLMSTPETPQRVHFDQKNFSSTFKYNLEEVSKAHENDKEFVLQCHISILIVRAVTLKQEMLAEPMVVEQIPDVTLIVGEKRFRASKQDLAVSSRKFNRLFFEVEGNKLKPEFTLKDVSAEEFENMLGVLQKTIRLTDQNLSGVLKSAKLYQIPVVLTECEMFLRNEEIDKKKMFELADQFNLETLKEDVLNSIKSAGELREYMPANTAELSEKTLADIATRFIEGQFSC